MAPRVLEPAMVEGKPEVYEDENVHAIYNEIATHFSSTRYKVNFSPISLWSFSKNVRIAMAYNHQISLKSHHWLGRT